MSEDLSILLEKLQAADRDTWEDLKTSLGKLHRYQENNSYEVDVPETIKVVEKEALDILQGCLQRACQARGWWIEQSTFTAKPFAKIQKREDPEWMSYKGCGDSPASALLAAYLKAIEKEKS